MKVSNKNKLNRRSFLRAGSLAGAGVGLAGLAPKSIRVAFGGDGGINENVVVYIFMRGGPDWLSFITPMNGHPDRGNYDSLRVNGTAIPSAQLLALDDGWGIHPSASSLHNLYQSGDFAVITAAGLPIANRSHFEAERYVELGTPGNRFTSSGWLARHIQSAINLPASIPIPAMSAESSITFSLLGEPSALSLGNPGAFDFEGGSSNFEEEQEAALASIYGLGDSATEVAGSQALSALEIIEAIDFNGYVPDNGAVYPDTDLGDELRSIAQLIKENTGLRVAQADRGGWDTHTDQGVLVEAEYGGRVRDISDSVSAFLQDLDVPAPNDGNWKDRTVVMLMGEFGRRAFDNNDAGTDHGWGGNMLVAGGASVNGGQVYGNFLGLAPGDLFQNADVFATTDYRNVFSEVLIRHLGNNELGSILPGFVDYNPLGVINGPDLPPNFGEAEIVSRNGFE